MAHEDRDPAADWRREPEVGSATGGHLSPEVGATGPMFDPLTDPVPREHSRKVRPREAEEPQIQEEPLQSDLQPLPAARRAAQRRIVRRRVPLRRVKRTIKHVDPLSVLKLSLFYYAFFLAAWMGFVAILYSVVDSTGFFDAIVEFSEGVELTTSLDLSMGFFMKWAFIVGFIMYVLGCLANLVLAFLFNLASDVTGGIEVTFVERDQ